MRDAIIHSAEILLEWKIDDSVGHIYMEKKPEITRQEDFIYHILPFIEYFHPRELMTGAEAW